MNKINMFCSRCGNVIKTKEVTNGFTHEVTLEGCNEATMVDGCLICRDCWNSSEKVIIDCYKNTEKLLYAKYFQKGPLDVNREE